MRVLMWEHFAPGGPIRVGGHHFARRFLARGDRVAWCAGPLAPWNAAFGNDEVQARRRLWERGGEWLESGRLFAYAPLTWSPHRRRPILDSTGVARRTLRATTPSFAATLAHAGFEDVDLLFMEPGAPMTALLDLYPRARSVYRMCDDTAAFPDTPRSFAAIEREVFARVDLVVATARVLAERARKAGARHVVHLPNACEPQGFAAKVMPDPLLASLGRPLAIYAGALDHWFDTALVEDTARRRPDWRFALIGPERGARGPVLTAPNVHFLGPRAYDALPACFAAADAGLVPFRLTPMTDAIHPIKVYEYLAAGLPVVATPMAETAAMQAPIALARDADDFAAALESSRAQDAADGGASRAARIRFASRHTWDERFQRLLEAIGWVSAPAPDVPGDAPDRVPKTAMGGAR
ncbi:MAG TPA: glycosyltransferase [Candidatus Polarisedimenticolia bacterium]|jgi:glycosyltransferase involved in cell wall biosynthesis|nr:glycosyltransferase [Candidatus Polarisedimenticolia bacterium]